MLGRFNKLNGGIVTRADADIGRQRHLGQTHSTRVRVVGRAADLEWWNDWVAHVRWDLAETHIDVDQGSRMTREPARLEGNSTAADRPFGSVSRSGHSTT